MTPPPNSTADNIDGINTDYDADPRARNLILYIFEMRWTLVIISSHYSKPKISNGTAI